MINGRILTRLEHSTEWIRRFIHVNHMNYYYLSDRKDMFLEKR